MNAGGIEIDTNQAMDVVEIDAASNRGIDEIRDLKEGIVVPIYLSKSFHYRRSPYAHSRRL